MFTGKEELEDSNDDSYAAKEKNRIAKLAEDLIEGKIQAEELDGFDLIAVTMYLDNKI